MRFTKKVCVFSLIIVLIWVSIAITQRFPILLVHGLDSTSQKFVTGCLKSTLESAGYQNQVYLIEDFPKGRTIYEDVIALKAEIDRIKQEIGIDKVTIIAYSRGGLVAEYYTMMYGNQHQDIVTYKYRPAGEKEPRQKIITGIPRYENDINQIIMLGTPQKGSGWANLAFFLPRRLAKAIAKVLGLSDPHTIAVEQLKKNSSFYQDFSEKELNPEVKYINIGEG